jgi:DNA-binding Lrp family transcriptional regulator
VKAIVLVKFASLETRNAYHHLVRLEPVTESYMTYGRFDAVAFIQANSLENIRNIILSEIQTIPGVVETMPCLIVEDALAGQARSAKS